MVVSQTLIQKSYNGTNFSEVNDMIMGRSGHQKYGGLSGDLILLVGGYTDSIH